MVRVWGEAVLREEPTRTGENGTNSGDGEAVTSIHIIPAVLATVAEGIFNLIRVYVIKEVTDREDVEELSVLTQITHLDKMDTVAR